MVAIPEFILRRLYVPGSTQATADGFAFDLNNNLAPATLLGFTLEVDGTLVPKNQVVISMSGGESVSGSSISSSSPLSLPVGRRLHITVQGVKLGKGRLGLRLQTREVGDLGFTLDVKLGARAAGQPPGAKNKPYAFASRLLSSPYAADVVIDAGSVIGRINPWIYGHFVEHLERCVYGGIWTPTGELRQDTLKLVQVLKPGLIRYPGGNFASGYHWEDGVGYRDARPRRYDEAWQVWETNQVGTDEFLSFCAQVDAAAYLVANDASGTPEEAARWVEYCNAPALREVGGRRAANGHAEPYGVKLWGIGNEVWGPWQIGHTDAGAYSARLRKMSKAMRSADPTIQIVGVGNTVLSDSPHDPGREWNETVLLHAGDRIDYLSFHHYTPGESGWQEAYDLEELHRQVCAAPLAVEQMICRMADQIANAGYLNKVKIALDEWNLWLPPTSGSHSQHEQVYTRRDALYISGMLNTFHRQCNSLGIANLAQLANVLPLIITDGNSAYATPLYYPFWLYRQMENHALAPLVSGPDYSVSAFGDLAGQESVPYLDVSATRNVLNQRLVVSMVNRHPYQRASVEVGLRGFEGLKPVKAWQIAGPPMETNTVEDPKRVCIQVIRTPDLRADHLSLALPPGSVTVFALEL